jgi:hypothetical protein
MAHKKVKNMCCYSRASMYISVLYYIFIFIQVFINESLRSYETRCFSKNIVQTD